MGKKKAGSNLGRTLVKDRFGHKSTNINSESFLHTSELEDGLEWGRLNLQSVTEQSTLDDFLATAELAGTEFTAERLNISFVSEKQNSGLPSKEELASIDSAQQEHQDMLSIPRSGMAADELELKERESFLLWRRQLAKLQEVKHITMTPFEKNLDFWRQLWRVIERSDIVAQIVDARNPLLFFCDDLDCYVQEVDNGKLSLVIVNKADFLSAEQRSYWAEYFAKEGKFVVFWSALKETERQKEASAKANAESESDDVSDSEGSEYDIDDDEFVDTTSRLVAKKHRTNITVDAADVAVESDCDVYEEHAVKGSQFYNSCRIYTADDLCALFKNIHSSTKVQPGITTVGLVGYPNVGKSSTINAILKTKKVPVSATPGRTKHFQTLFVEPSLLLCDCPGLVMPTFVKTKADLVVSGILPIDQMRDYVPPVSLVCSFIPRHILEVVYGILLPPPEEGEDPNRPSTAYELLAAHARMRGFMTHKGVPDFARSSRCVLKDYVNGKLLYSHAPPSVASDVYGSIMTLSIKSDKKLQPVESRVASKQLAPGIDEAFFQPTAVRVASKGVHGTSDFARKSDLPSNQSSHCSVGPSERRSTQTSDKPWKKHHNKGKKEKLRRKHATLDA